MNRPIRPSTPRTLPAAALIGPGRRDMLFVHGSLSAQAPDDERDEAPLGAKMRRRRVELIERGGAKGSDDGSKDAVRL